MTTKNKNIFLVVIIITGITIGVYVVHARVRQNRALSTVSTVSTMYANITCKDSALAQLEAYNADPLATTTFDKYKVPVYTGPLSMLNTKTSSKQISNFKTIINSQLTSTGINFAGKYTLVHVDMTGQGKNYILVDRTNGMSIIVPYEIEMLSTQADSLLLIINPRSMVLKQTTDSEDQLCGPTSIPGIYGVDLRPYYYIWNGTAFQNLGPLAPINQFWKQQ